MTVLYRLERTGRTPHELHEVLVTTSCPSCLADWRPRGAALPRGSARHFLCAACGEIHPAVLVTEDGTPVRQQV